MGDKVSNDAGAKQKEESFLDKIRESKDNNALKRQELLDA